MATDSAVEQHAKILSCDRMEFVLDDPLCALEGDIATLSKRSQLAPSYAAKAHLRIADVCDLGTAAALPALARTRGDSSVRRGK
jgi:hypothetical protein